MSTEGTGPKLVALDCPTGLMRRYQRGPQGKLLELDVAQFDDWSKNRWREGGVMESLNTFRRYGSGGFT